MISFVERGEGVRWGKPAWVISFTCALIAKLRPCIHNRPLSLYFFSHSLAGVYRWEVMTRGNGRKVRVNSQIASPCIWYTFYFIYILRLVRQSLLYIPDERQGRAAWVMDFTCAFKAQLHHSEHIPTFLVIAFISPIHLSLLCTANLDIGKAGWVIGYTCF